ncbi:MAG: isoprenylcysteine carboxylmethyltransferase family protein [Planctomycetota bacterium]
MAVPKLVFTLRGLLVSPPLIFAFFCRYKEMENDWLVWPIGASSIFLGIILRIWARWYKQPARHQLVTAGPYSYVRNPLYISNTLICLGAVFASRLFWLAPVMFVWCIIAYSFVIRYEENLLLQKYGDQYREYMTKISRWIPTSHIQGNTSEGRNPSILFVIFEEGRNALILVLFILKEFTHKWF